jgi:hypothetical protein
MDGIRSGTLEQENIKTEERLENRTSPNGNGYAKREHQRFEV